MLGQAPRPPFIHLGAPNSNPGVSTHVGLGFSLSKASKWCFNTKRSGAIRLKPLLLYRAIANGFHPTTHKVSLQTSKTIILPKTRASCYSHHLSKYALRETNWLFRVLGCNPYLNPYLIIYIEAPPWSLTKRFVEIRPLHEAPPWDFTKRFMELRPSHKAPPWDLTKRFMELRPTHTIAMSHQPTIDLSCISISCQYTTNHLTMFHTHWWSSWCGMDESFLK